MIETLPAIVIHEIEAMDLRSVFLREDRTFTPWLIQPQNLARLARSLGIEIELEALEANSGTFRTDILAKNVADGTTVVIENQFGRSDHDHFGKAMTYLAAHGARTVVWIAEAFADEHRAALTWLNDNTPEDVGFYAVVPRLMRIAGSPPGLQFEVDIKPNKFVKQQIESRTIDSAITDIRERFWGAFNSALQVDEHLGDCRLRYGGRLGFQWLLPNVGGAWTADEPHVLVFIQAGKGRQGIGMNLYCNTRGCVRPEAEERLQLVRNELQAQNIPLGVIPADLSDATAMQTSIGELLVRVKTAAQQLVRAFV